MCHSPDPHGCRQQFPHVHQRLLSGVSSPPPCLGCQKEAAAGHLKRMREGPQAPAHHSAPHCRELFIWSWQTARTAWSGLVPMKANSCPRRTLYVGLSLLSSMASDCRSVKELLRWLVTWRRLEGKQNKSGVSAKRVWVQAVSRA